MCGINGILLGPHATPRDLRADIAAMNRAIVHRGPDDEGEYHESGVALGFRRLSILDLSPAGHQPMCNEDGTLWLVFNGEIYNYRELQSELQARGHTFRSRCDAEVILHGYEEWGEDCLQRFNGMWAFALWDVRRRRLFASRDRLGVKPFVYLDHDGEFAFSSEIAGLNAVYSLRRANLPKLHDYLAFGYRTNDGQTFFEGVHELPPGHFLTFEAGRTHLHCWWSLPEAPKESVTDPAGRLRELLTDAVRLRLRSDVPVALLQSGGLDSSAICAIVDDELAAGHLDVDSVTAFTAVHPGHAYDESAKVEALMKRCPRIRSVQIEPFAGDIAEHLPVFVRAMQEPMFSATSYAHWCLMQAVHAQGIKVILNGQGADEAFAGYGRYISGYRLLDVLLSRPWHLPAEIMDIRKHMGQKLGAQAAQFAKALLGRRAAAAWRGWVTEGGSRYLAPGFRREHGGRLLGSTVTATPRNLDAYLRGQLLHYGFNQILHYEDRSSMSQSVEMRSPFVDYRVMTFAFSLPTHERFAGGITKRVVRDAFADRLPPEIVHEHNKIGFAIPTERWLEKPAFREFLHNLVSSPEFLDRSLWKGRSLADALRGRVATPADFPAWRFITTELWLRAFSIENS